MTSPKIKLHVHLEGTVQLETLLAMEARELYGVEVRLTPDITRGSTPEEAETTVRHSIAPAGVLSAVP